jgi:hypothetical protein
MAWLVGAVACATGPVGSASQRANDPTGVPARLDPAWTHEQLRDAALRMNAAFSSAGSEGLLRLRLHGDEISGLFTPNAAERITRIPTGLYPNEGEQRWHMFSALSHSPLVGFCARGVRTVEPNGEEGFRQRALVVDRLLLVGSEPGGLWGAWVEGLLLTPSGWRLLPTIPYDRQVQTPRRDHADVQLWDCDIGERPRPNHPL